MTPVTDQDLHFLHIIVRSAESQYDLLIFFWFCRNYIILCTVAKQRFSVHII